ncbi:condensin complex component cnd1 [Lophiostoma macrostomum CBS 122681]|uniref:Condensin complex subunit 1 n=1 Tax=Lophiostoma macrostomum CBS 122681 TaxID=1314788 RepID=A0A6A6T189_9PLEO|nr:condensin complex component cnd1 [Lophiostoma macrostomum CBS 122681]
MADDDPVNFDLNESLKQYSIDPTSIETERAPAELVECENDPESLTPALINSILNPVVDAVATSPEAIIAHSRFDTLLFLLKISAQIPHATLSKIVDLLTSAIIAQAELANSDLLAGEEDTVSQHKQLLEIYGFLLQWAVSAVEAGAQAKPASAPAKGRGKGTKAKAGAKDGNWDASAELLKALGAMGIVFKLHEGLGRIFVTTPNRDTFVTMFTKSAYHILENEARVKNTAIKEHCFGVLCTAVKHHGHAFDAQTAIDQNLSYFEHLSEPMAEFLQILAERYDYPQLTEEVLKDISNKEFSSNDLKGPKSVSTFLTKISELLPEVVNKQIALLAKLLETDSYTLRCAIIEICGNLITMLSKKPEINSSHEAQIDVFFQELEQRFQDVNPYCRSRVLQVYVKLCDLGDKFPEKQRCNAARKAKRSLKDKSSNVRRNAIKLLRQLVLTHPYQWKAENQREEATVDNFLSAKTWGERLKATQEKINMLKPPQELQEHAEGDEPTADDTLMQDATQAEDAPQDEPKHPNEMSEEERAALTKKLIEEAATTRELEKLQADQNAAKKALDFCEVIDKAADTITQLLSSKNKAEVIEAMDFFSWIDAYKVQNARTGIRKMLRLVWAKGNSDEGKGVQSHLIDCYRGLYFNAPPGYSANDTANYIAKNMISLTFGTTPAEQTSLEQLLSIMMKQGLVKELVTQKLWYIYGYQKRDTSKNQRQGAIMVLGMLALADPEIIVREMEKCLRIGLGELGRRDLQLARYTCIALRRISPPPGKQSASENPPQVVKLPNDHAVLARLAAIVEIVSDSKEWFGVAEQAIGAIYVLAKHPDVLCSEILRRKTKHVFAPHARPVQPTEDSMMSDGGNTPLGSEDVQMEEGPPSDSQSEVQPQAQQPAKQQNAALALSQLLFIVGHVAIKQIVHLELCELEFKRRKAEDEKKKKGDPRESVAPENPSSTKRGRKKGATKEKTPAPEDGDDLDLVGGTTEDDFTDAIQQIRERELLYGPQSLLANFGPLVTEICHNNTSYNHPTLQAQAALCLAKLMCVSSEYCEGNLSLLLTILERSKDAVVRSNLVLALGDMAVCFNHLIDENTDFLYRRLQDGDPSVKRTCLMTLTFLILAGQVKVKGQLGEMAKCLEDSDQKIKDMTRMFFTELATKDNAVYNQFVDMFSVLSADSALNEDAFKRIIKFLTTFIEKDKHAKQLANKIAARLPRAENERQWNDAAYALGLLQHKDEEIQKVVAEGFKVVQTVA